MRKFLSLLLCMFVYVFVYAQPSIQPAGPTGYCPTGSVVLTVNDYAPGSTFLWKKNGVTITPVANTFRYAANSIGTYTVLLISGADTIPVKEVEVTAFASPSPTYKFDIDSACSGTNIQFTSVVTNGTAPYKYLWNFGDGKTSTDNDPQHAFTSLGCGYGTFNVTLTVTDANGCSAIVPAKKITVKQAPDVQVKDQSLFTSFSNCDSNPTPLKPNYTITIVNSSPNPACISSYSIDWGDGKTQSNIAFPLTHTYTQLGAFNLIVSAIGTNGCAGTFTHVVANQSNPDIGIATFGTTIGCAPLPVATIITTWQANSPGTTYKLTFGDGSSIPFSHPINPTYFNDTVYHTYNTSPCPTPTYQLEITATNACKSKSFKGGDIEVRTPPQAKFSVPNPTYCIGTSVCLTNETVFGSYSNCSTATDYTWDFGDNSPLGTAANSCHVYTKAGIYEVILTTKNPCGTSTFKRQICITGPPVSSFILDKNEGCTGLGVTVTNNSSNGSTCAQVTYLWSVTYTATNCGTGSSWVFAGNSSASSINPSFTFSNAGTYKILLTVTNVCLKDTSSKTVVIKNPPVVTLPAIPNACSSLTITPVPTITNCGSGTPTYLWTFTGGSISTSPNLNPGPVTFTTGPHTITLAVTNECGTTTASQTFNINPLPSLAGVPGDLTSCGAQQLGPFNFTSSGTVRWTNSNTLIGLGNGGNTATIPAFTPQNNGASAITATIVVIASKDGCSYSDTFNITVNPRPVKPTAARTLSYCLNEAASPLTATATAGDTLRWYTGYPLINGNNSAPVPFTATAGTTFYYVTQANSFGCESDTAKITVIVYAKIFNSTVSADQTICNGSSAQSFTGTIPGGGSGTYSYQWQSSPDNAVTWTNTIGAVSANFNPGAVTTTTKYRRIVASNSCSDTSNIITITVQGSLTNTDISASQTICAGGRPDTLRGQLPSSGNTITYQWESSPDNATWSTIPGAISLDYAPPVLTTTTYYKRKVLSGECSAYSSTLKVTVNAKPVVNIVTDQHVCNNSSSPQIAFSGTPTGISYTWANDNTLIGIAANGTGNILPFTAINSSNPKVPVVANIVVIPTNTFNDVGCSGDAISFKITILPTININKIQDEVKCTGSAIPAFTPTPDTGTFAGIGIRYRWAVTGSGITLSDGSGPIIPSYSTINNSTTDVVATIRVTPVYSYSGTTCDGTPVFYTVTVKSSTPSANAGADTILCNATSASLAATFVNGTTGLWTQIATNAIIASPNSSTTMISGLQPGIYTFVWSQSGFASCPATTDTVVIDNKRPLVNKIDTDTVTICAGNTITIKGEVPSGGNGAYKYQWQQSPGGVNYTDIAGANSQNLVFTPTTTTRLRRYVDAAPCNSYSDALLIIMQPAIANNIISADDTICTGTTPKTINGSLPTGGNDQFSYVWEQRVVGQNSWTLIPNASLQSYGPGTLTQTTSYRRRVETSLCFAAFGNTSNVVTVTVNPNASALFIPAAVVQCPPFIITPAIINLQTSTANSQYLWFTDGKQIGSGTSFPGYTITRGGDSVIIELITISAYGCRDDSLFVKFSTPKTPNPSFTLSDTTGCGPLNVQATNTSTNINEFNYLWNFGNSQTSTLVQPPPIIFATNPNYGDTVYPVTLTVNSICQTLRYTRTIRVKSAPKALFTPTLTTGCSPMTVTFKNTSKGSNNKYLWRFGDGSTLPDTTNEPVQHVYFSGVVDTFYASLTVVNECGADSIGYFIVVSPNTIRLNLAVNGTELYGCDPHAVAFINNSRGASVFRWNFGDGASTTTAKNTDTVYHTYQSAGVFKATLQALNNCSDTATTVTITIYPKPDAIFTLNKYNLCKGDSVQFNNRSAGASAYLWQFGDGITSSLANPAHTYNIPGTYVVQMTAYSNNPSGNICTDTASQQITVTASQPGSFTSSNISGTCVPLTVTFVNQTKPAATVLWDFGDLSSGVGDSVSHSFLSGGVFTVTLTVTAPGGCTYITRQTVTVSAPTGTLQYAKGFSCDRNAVRLQAVASGATSYQWNFGDGVTLTTTQQIVFHNYTNAGNYIPSVTLKNDAGCLVPLKGIDTIKVDRIESGFTYSRQQFCGYSTVNYIDTSHIFFGKALVKWDFGDGTAGSGTAASHTYAAGGNYTIRMIVLSNSGCADTVVKQLAIPVNSKPVIAINAPATGCAGTVTRFNAVIQAIDAINLTQWTASDGATGTGQTFNHIFGLPGAYTVQVVTGTVNGCYDTATSIIQVNQAPTVTATNALTICRGASSALSVSGAATYQWTPLQGLSCYTCAAPVAAPTITTPYIVEGKNLFGCAATDTVVITVIQPLRMNVSPGDSICVGQSANLLVSGASFYNWSPPQGLNSTTISNPTASPTVTTIYRVVGYDGYNCFTDTAFITVGVGQYPTVNLGPDLTLSTGTLQPLSTAITNGPISKWLWSPVAELSCSTCALPVATIKKPITYSVIATTPYGCSGSDSISIKVFCDNTQVFIPNAFTPDDDGLNDILMVRSKGIVQVKYFRIFNRWGEMIFEKSNFPPNDPLYGWNGMVKNQKVAPDVFVYTCEVMCENGSLFSYKGNITIIK